MLADAPNGEAAGDPDGTGSELSLVRRRVREAHRRGRRRPRRQHAVVGTLQPARRRVPESVLPSDVTARVACEAAIKFGWERYLGFRGVFVGMNGFGASAPAPLLYKHFGITAEAVYDAAKKLL